MEVPTVLAIGLGLVSLLLLLKHFLFLSKRLPPGPRPLPLLGNLPLLLKSPSLVSLAIDLRRTYGPIFTIWLGARPAIVICEPAMIHEAIIKKGTAFMGRAQFKSTAIVNNNHRGLLTGVGERHRFFRKLIVSEVLANHRLSSFGPTREKEIDILIEKLKEEVGKCSGVVTNFRSLIRLAISNMLMGICFGRRLTLEEYVEIDYVTTQRVLLALGKPRDYIPFLQLLPDKKGREKQLDLRKKIDNFFVPLLDERRRILASGKAPEKSMFADTLLVLQDQPVKSGDETIDMSDADIVSFCMDILTAGTDTTGTNLEYAMARLLNHPQIQEKLFHEISAVVGEREVGEGDIPKLPYLQALVKESLRMHSPARLSPARVSLSPTKIAGYDIPANAIILQNLEAVAMDPLIWENPMEFRPERFLDKTVDFTGSNEISLIPFGTGRRMCPASNIALLHAHLVIARLVQTFEWKAPIPGELLDLSPATAAGITSPMETPLKALLRERRSLRG